MTNAQVSELQAKWKKQGVPLCEHPIQELSRSDPHDNGDVLRTYHCCECGEAIVHNIKL
jgi:hypothetical protein